MSSIAQEVPTEVMEQIFAPFSATLAMTYPSKFPWFLGHVCSMWRSTFLSMTAEFWNHISISFKDVQREDDTARAVNVIRFFLKRDPAAPFSFAFEFPGSFSSLPAQRASSARQILEMLIDGSIRWKDASFQTDASNLSPLSSAKDRLPLLRELLLTNWDQDGGEAPGLVGGVFQTAPSLKVINFWHLANWKFTWSNLRAVKLGCVTCCHLPLLSQMTNLESLSIANTSISVVNPDSNVVLPRLTALTCPTRLLPFLTAPILEDLTIDSGSISFPPVIVSSFLCRSSCNILHLQVRDSVAVMAIETIKHTPQITQLKLSNVVNMDLVLEQLIIPMNPVQEPLARHMLCLQICCVTKTNIPLSSLSRLLLSRTCGSDNHGHKRLQDLSICMPGYDQVTEFQSLVALCKEQKVHYIQIRNTDMCTF